MAARLLFFDVGETLVSEERMWSQWADWLGVPRGTFFAALGAVIQARRHHEDVFEVVRPGIDLAAERAARLASGTPAGFLPEDVYPDTVAALDWARRRGFRLGFAGNHSRRTEDFVRALCVPADLVGSSEAWGVAKPDPGFFRKIVDLSGLPPNEIVYVGDRIDNDVLPALRAGMQAIFVARGPWGIVQAGWPEASEVPVRIANLGDLPHVLGA